MRLAGRAVNARACRPSLLMRDSSPEPLHRRMETALPPGGRRVAVPPAAAATEAVTVLLAPPGVAAAALARP